ncbi:MAG TPA: helix-turn-helix transcriptional regulator [Gammaproteobacteria bacterium]|jgi:transcriptional regulator with XRE-family HTH domain|nr:helix-turn-helix transcriptional regulator [Gammaproteobacteria bacterium]
MDMKVDSSYIKAQRARRAWSQEHLAEVTGLGLRTIQRIEKTGAASYESARALAAVFEMDVAELRVAPPVVVEPRRVNLSLRQVLGVVGALVTGGALLVTTSTFAADKVLMDLSVAVDSKADEDQSLATKVVVDDGALVPEVNDLKLGDLRFSIVPRVQTPDRILLEVSIYERRGDQEFVVSEPRLIALSGEAASIVLDDDARTVRLGITAEVNPPLLPPTLRGR